jgi:hypothetical protein
MLTSRSQGEPQSPVARALLRHREARAYLYQHDDPSYHPRDFSGRVPLHGRAREAPEFASGSWPADEDDSTSSDFPSTRRLEPNEGKKRVHWRERRTT